MTEKLPTSRSPNAPEPAASLASISVRRARTWPVQRETVAPDTPQEQVSIPRPTNDDTPPSVSAFGTRTNREIMPVHVVPPIADAGMVAPAAMIDLWEHLAAQRLRPELKELDTLVIARQWPNSLLLRVKDCARRPALEVAHMFAPAVGGPTVAIPIDAMTVDWIVALGREVVTTESPVHETDAVPTARGAIPCGVIVLPFGPADHVDHVLCHLYRVDDTMLEGEAILETRLPPRDRTGIKRLFGR